MYGGIGKATRDIASGMAHKGIEVHVVTLRHAEQRALEDLNGFKVHGHSIHSYPFTGPIYRKIDAEVYHSQEPSLGTLIAKNAMCDATHVVTCHNPRTRIEWKRQRSYYKFRRRIYNRLFEPMVCQAVRRADAVFCQSHHIIGKAKELYRLKQDPQFLPNPVRIPKTKSKKASEPTVCFLGRLDPEKNPEKFIEIARALPDIKFIMAGKAQDPNRDRKISKAIHGISNLEHMGFVDGSDKDRLLEKAWVLVNTSHVESLPVAFLEAAAHRCAILSPHDPDGFATRFGYHVTGGDYVSGIKWLIGDDHWREMGDKGYMYVSEVHELDRVIDLHLKKYRRLLE